MKEFNIIIDLSAGCCSLIYTDNDKIKEFAKYEITGLKITEIYNTSVDLALIKDMENLTRMGFRYNPYLIDNN